MKKKTSLGISVLDLRHVKKVSAWSIWWKNGFEQLEPAGRIVANWSDCENGPVCTLGVLIHEGPLAEASKGMAMVGKAGGFNHDKFSAALIDALERSEGFPEDLKARLKRGSSEPRKWLESLGYIVHEVL